MATTQISAVISAATKERMDRYVRAFGANRADLVEQALLHHLQALDELPREAIVPARVVLDPDSAKRVRDLTSHPPKPTAAMRRLFRDR